MGGRDQSDALWYSVGETLKELVYLVEYVLAFIGNLMLQLSAQEPANGPEGQLENERDECGGDGHQRLDGGHQAAEIAVT